MAPLPTPSPGSNSVSIVPDATARRDSSASLLLTARLRPPVAPSTIAVSHEGSRLKSPPRSRKSEPTEGIAGSAVGGVATRPGAGVGVCLGAAGWAKTGAAARRPMRHMGASFCMEAVLRRAGRADIEECCAAHERTMTASPAAVSAGVQDQPSTRTRCRLCRGHLGGKTGTVSRVLYGIRSAPEATMPIHLL